MIYIIIPAYNEVVSLPNLFPKITQVMAELGEEYKIIVCNDGSRDGTAELLNTYQQTMPLTVITHHINRGLGETMRDLFEEANKHTQDDDIIVRVECDDTHEPKYIKQLIEQIKAGFDVVIASRFQPGGGQTGLDGYRSFISRCANLFMKCFFPLKGVKEYSSGFRAYRGSIIRRAIDLYGNNMIQLKGLGFTCTLEILVKLKMLDAKFTEIPFVLKYDQKQSESKMVSSITTFGYFTLALLYHWPWGGWRRAYKKKIKNAR